MRLWPSRNIHDLSDERLQSDRSVWRSVREDAGEIAMLALAAPMIATVITAAVLVSPAALLGIVLTGFGSMIAAGFGIRRAAKRKVARLEAELQSRNDAAWHHALAETGPAVAQASAAGVDFSAEFNAGIRAPVNVQKITLKPARASPAAP